SRPETYTAARAAQPFGPTTRARSPGRPAASSPGRGVVRMPIARLRPRRLVARPVSPSHRRPVPLTVEPLDDRVLPSATMVAQLNPATADAIDPSLAAVSFHGALYFTADDGHGGGVFRSDGTTAGTTLIKAFPMTDAYVPHALVVSGG